MALEVPGPEIEEVGKKAKRYKCYIVFGTYAKDPENWPGHILHLMIMMGPDGNVVATHWKQRNVRGLFPGSEQYTSSIYDVYDRFVEMYGIDAVIPVVQTDVGNIAMSAVQFEPELFRCMALKGAEIICRVATGGFEYEDMRLTSYHNSVYTMIANNSVTTQGRNPGFFEDEAYGGSGRSAIFGPRGVELAKAGMFECKQFALLPMAEFREKHRIPDVHMELYRPVFDQYRTRYDHSAYLEHMPQDKREAFAQFAKNSRWTHYW
jgi:predicted amidohydrolase